MAYPRQVQPDDGDDRQALRTRRFLMAAGTSLMVIALLGVAYLFGGLEWTGLVQGTGLNLKLKDPSLTVP